MFCTHRQFLITAKFVQDILKSINLEKCKSRFFSWNQYFLLMDIEQSNKRLQLINHLSFVQMKNWFWQMQCDKTSKVIFQGSKVRFILMNFSERFFLFISSWEENEKYFQCMTISFKIIHNCKHSNTLFKVIFYLFKKNLIKIIFHLLLCIGSKYITIYLYSIQHNSNNILIFNNITGELF